MMLEADPEVAEGIGALTRYRRKGGAATKMDDSVGGGPQRWPRRGPL